jgi:NAD(P)-dependent dehydrogenase (short-subunit alcohol dehydrogenase family)
MTDKKTWLITGAGRGMGVDFAKAALAAGHNVVATGRNPDTVTKAVGEAADLLAVKLDVTSRQDAEAAVTAAVDRFGGIDVLVNNAGNFYAGYFEELTPEQIERQLATTLVGPMNVTRAVLPVMRKQRSGQIISVSSTAGLLGFEFCTAYAASKFGLEGWMESLAPEVEPFRITTTIVNPSQARPGAHDHRDRRAAAAPLHRRRRRDRAGRAEDRPTPGADRRLPRAVDVTRARRRPDERVTAFRRGTRRSGARVAGQSHPPRPSPTRLARLPFRCRSVSETIAAGRVARM